MNYSIERLVRYQLYAPTRYSSVTWRPYGLLFRNPLAPDCYDANHAVILDLNCDFPAALSDIEKHFRARCITPRIFGGFQKGEEALFPLLKERSWRIEPNEGLCAMVLSAPCTLPESPDYFVEEPKELTMELSSFLAAGIGPWALDWSEYLLPHPDCRAYLVRARDGSPAAYGAVVSNGECACLENVFTLPRFRRQGFCSALLRRIVSAHQSERPGLPLYLLTASEEACRLYEKAGFRKVEYPYAFWSAYLSDE